MTRSFKNRKFGETANRHLESSVMASGRSRDRRSYFALQDRLGNRATSRLVQDLRGSGQPLSDASRDHFESSFNRPLSDVRIHDDSESNALAASLQARAFTVGNHIVFGQGEYRPDATNGRRLLAHELTHALQQPSLETSSVGSLNDAAPSAEAEARLAVVKGETEGAQVAVDSTRPLAIAAEGPEQHPGRDHHGAALLWWYFLRPMGVRYGDYLNGEGLLFGATRNPELSARQLNALSGLLWASHYQNSTIGGESPEYSAGWDMFQHLSGDTSPELSLASLAFPGDLGDFLGEAGEAAFEDHPWWLLLYASSLQGIISGTQAGIGDDISFLSLFDAALEDWFKAPTGLGRLYDINDRDDPQWSPYPFWGRPSGLSLDWTGREEDSTSPEGISLKAGVNLAEILGWYPEDDDEEVRRRYRGWEIYPYMDFAHQWGEAGESEVALPRTRFLLGSLLGANRFYGELGAGADFTPGSELNEVYGRANLFVRDLGPLALGQLGAEMSYRPDIGDLWRLNAGAEFNMVDNSVADLVLGLRAGGLLPGGDRDGALDLGARLALMFHVPLSGYRDPFDLGFDVSTSWRTRDPFDAASDRLFGLRAGVNLLDLFSVNFEYNNREGPLPLTGRPEDDLRFMIMFGEGIFRRR